MVERAHSPIYLSKFPTYIGTTICAEWQYFTNFKTWMGKQDYKNKVLDKDLLNPRAKIYSPETCCFIASELNTFLTDSRFSKNEELMGVSKLGDKFVAQCNNKFNKNRGYLGTFDTELEAHLAWKRKKHEYALKFAELETDSRIIKALQTRYLN